MDAAPLCGMALALGSVLTAVLLEGTAPTALLLLAPVLLVLVGSIGATAAGSTAADLRQLRRWTRAALTPHAVPSGAERVRVLCELATSARRDGLLALDRRLGGLTDPLLRHGVQLAVDGAGPELLRSRLAAEMAARRSDDLVAARFFARMGGAAPTVGILGTVLGLVQVLTHLDRGAGLGPLIAAAFVATLWGVGSANLLWLPMSARIRRTSDLELGAAELVLAGITGIQAGLAPRLLRQRLTAMLVAA